MDGDGLNYLWYDSSGRESLEGLVIVFVRHFVN